MIRRFPAVDFRTSVAAAVALLAATCIADRQPLAVYSQPETTRSRETVTTPTSGSKVTGTESVTVDGDGNATVSSGVGFENAAGTKTTTRDGATTVTRKVDSTTAGSATTTAGSDGSVDIAVGGRRGNSASVSTETRHGDADGTHYTHSGSLTVEGGGTAEVTVGTGGAKAELGADLTVQGTVGVSGQYGNERYNVHGEGEIKVSAELVAALKAELKVDENGAAVGIDGKIGASSSVEGTIKGGVTLCGVPVDVVLSGSVSVGAEASAAAGAAYDATTGKLTLTLEASAVLGAGAGGSIQVEVGVKQLSELVAGQLGRVSEQLVLAVLGDDTEYIRDLLQTKDLREKIRKILLHEIDKNGKRGDKDFLKKMAEALMAMYDRGGEFSELYQYLRALIDRDHTGAQAILRKIAEQMARREEGGDPFDSEAEDEDEENDGSRAPTFQGVTPLEAY